MRDALTGNSRYEVLRRLSPREFADLFTRNLVGEKFDAMVDALGAASKTCPTRR